jgi:hypothetical protein
MNSQRMSEIVDLLAANSIVCVRLKLIENSQLKTRKKIACFLGVNTTSHYMGLWRRFSSSRLVLKEVQEFMDLQERLEKICDHRVLQNILIVQSTVCSKALHVIKKRGWKVLNVSV